MLNEIFLFDFRTWNEELLLRMIIFIVIRLTTPVVEDLKTSHQLKLTSLKLRLMVKIAIAME